jgi:RNA polymerase sigma-70 factor (ECF subfamily)
MVQKSDEDLLRAWQGGDQAAGQALFRRHIRNLQRFFRTKVAPRDQDDLIQETLMGCLTGAASFRGDASFRTFLFSVAWNKFNDHVRRQGRQPAMTDLDEVSVADLVPGFSTVQAKKREQALLLEALRTIPLNDQIVIELKCWEQLSNPEIGEILGLEVSAVASRFRRAKERLEQRLERLSATRAEIASVLDGLDGWAGEIRDLLGRPDPDHAPGKLPLAAAPG